MNLLRYLRSIGLRPVAAGNLKGMLDPYRTPATQKEFAEKYGQNPAIVTSFADGTKLSMEAAILANATGFRVGRRGMYGPRCAHVKEMAAKLPLEQVLAGGLVDYALGAEPGTGAFVLVHEENPAKRSTLSYLKMGDGPLYAFYTPYHLPHLQIVATVRAAPHWRPTRPPPPGGTGLRGHHGGQAGPPRGRASGRRGRVHDVRRDRERRRHRTGRTPADGACSGVRAAA